MNRLMAGALLLFFPLFLQAQSGELEVQSLPKLIEFKLYPESLGGRSGHQLDVYDITLSSGVISARITMHGLGQDKCTIRAHPAEGSYKGGKILIKAKIETGDNKTCLMALDFSREADGKYSGRYTNSRFAGDLRQD